jgi:hypothetical protein
VIYYWPTNQRCCNNPLKPPKEGAVSGPAPSEATPTKLSAAKFELTALAEPQYDPTTGDGPKRSGRHNRSSSSD